MEKKGNIENGEKGKREKGGRGEGKNG